jgi:hypothetical protein
MTPADLLALLPIIEAVLRDAPQIVGDIEALIARVKNPAASPTSAQGEVAKMAPIDDELKQF